MPSSARRFNASQLPAERYLSAPVYTPGCRGASDVEPLGDQRVHEPGRLARATDDTNVEVAGEGATEVANDHQADSLGVLRHARAVLRLPLDSPIRQTGVEQATFPHPLRVGRRRWRTPPQPHTRDGTEHRGAAAVLGVDQHRGPMLAIDGAQHFELRRILVRARQPVEPDDVLVRHDRAVHGPPHPFVAEVAEGAEVLDGRDVDVGDRRRIHERRC